MPDNEPFTQQDVENYNAAVGLMSQHVVLLVCHYDTIESDGSIKSSNAQVFSGWLIEMGGHCFWVTAGHCLKELDENIAKGYIRITGGGFMDYLGYRAQHHHTIPFTYERGCGFYIWDTEEGLDFALIHLSDLYRKGLASNNNIPIERKNWVQQHRLDFLFHRIVGIPEDQVFTSTDADGEVDVKVRPIMMGVEQITLAEAQAAGVRVPIKSDDWFIARIHRLVKTQTVVGMSGGPIYGFRYDDQGRLSYHVVAIQSWWDSEKRIVFGCSVPRFAEELYQEIKWRYEEFLREQGENDPHETSSGDLDD